MKTQSKIESVKAHRFSAIAIATIDTCRLPGESDGQVIERLLVMLLPIAADIDTFFGLQEPNVEK